MDAGGHRDPHKAGAESEPWSQKVVIRAEEARAEKGRIKVMASQKRAEFRLYAGRKGAE